MAYPKNGYNPPETLARTAHSVTIYSPSAEAIGLINGWSPAQSRTVTPIYEINASTSGLVLENIPGNVQGLTIAVNRYDIWPSRMEQAFGTVDLTMLSNQQKPFTVKEVWNSPDGTNETWVYDGVWFTQIGRAIRSDGDRIINVNASLMYVYKSKM